MASPYASTQETTNANRAYRVVLGPCTDGLRDILRYYIPPITFPHVIKVNEHKLSRLTADQRALILPRHGHYVGSYGDMDISLLYILLRNITNISPHSKGWGNDPDPHDTSLSANIERIRLVRNRCVHSCDPSMSNTDFNSIWSTIRSTMVDLDLFLVNGNKYEKAVYFLRHEPMDTAHDLHYEELRKQVEEDKTTREMVDNLENKIHECAEKFRRFDDKIHECAEKFRRFDDILENLNRSPIPQNVRVQCDINVQKWRDEDKIYHETHSFPSLMQKVEMQTYVTFVGVPGSGKSATAHHIALKLQEEGYEVVPIKDIRTIEQYGDPRNPQVFVIDDVVGVFGLQKTKLDVLSEYEQNIRKPSMVKSKTLMTCRWTVFNETLTYKPFFTKEKTVINLHSSDNALNDNDKKQILQKHGLNEILLAELTSTSRKFPLLCKLFSKKPKCKAIGPMFFQKPVKCILDELTDMQRHNKLNYATLVLCMLNKDCLSKDILKDIKNEHFINMKGDTLENCELEIQTNAFELMNALSAMEGTYTNQLDAQCGAQYTFIHKSMIEICAYHYGKQFPDQILLYMSSSYIAYHVKPHRDEPGSVNKIEEKECDSESVDGDESNNDNDGKEESYDENNEREESFDLCIRLREDQYPLLAKRLYRDIQNMELYDVFRNQVLKHPQVCQAFIGVLETMTFTEFKFLFLSSQEQVDAIVSKRKNVVDKSRGRSEWGEWERQEVLVDERPKRHDKGFTYNVRVISWVIYYGHHRILKYIVQRTDRPDAISELFEISRKVFGNHTEKRLEEQYRLLVLSCYSGDVDTVRVLLPLCQETINGTYVRRTCINEQSPLPIACKGGYVPVVKLLLKAGADVNLQDASGNTPLITACKEGYVMVVKELLEAGAIVDLLGRRGNTPLIAACKGGHASVVEELVKAGADVNLQNSWGDTPLIAACKEGHVNVVEELANAGADINLQDRAGNTAMIAACKGGHVIVVERLVKVGADVNLQNKWGDTPLMTAYSEGHVSVVKELVKEGADVNLQDKYGNTPLVAAVNEKHVSVVEDFLYSRIGDNPNDECGDTALITACKEGHVRVVEKLVKAGANVNLQDREGDTPLMIACNEGHVSVVEDLMEAGAGVNLQNRRGNTALIYVCKRGHMKLLEKLVQAGADLNLQNDCRNTPLIVASKGGHVGVVKELVKKGADVNLQDKWGNTPLIYACKAGYTSVVEELVKAGADVTLRGRLGNTPLIAAVRTCPLSTVKYLVEHKADIITQVVDVNVSVVYTALILNKPEIVKYLIQEQNKIIPGRYHGNVHLFNCLLDIRHAGVKTDSRDDVVVTNRSVWRMGRGGDLLRTISEGDCDVLRRLLSVGLDVNQLIQLNKPDVRPLLYTLIDERYGVLHRTEVGVLFGAGMDVNFRLKYKEYDSVLDRNGVSVLERTRRLMCKYSESKDYTDKRRVSGYKRVMCEIKKHVRRHSV